MIRISDANWKRLQAWAVPLEDRPDDVISRVLDIAERERHALIEPSHRVRKREEQDLGRVSDHLEKQAYRPVILRVLKQLGGKGETEEVCRRVFEETSAQLRPGDLRSTLSSGEPHWRNRVRWERREMAKDGLLLPSRRHGLWELSDDGWRAANEA